MWGYMANLLMVLITAIHCLLNHSWTRIFLRGKCDKMVSKHPFGRSGWLEAQPSNTNRHTQCAWSECWRIYHISISPSLCHLNPHSWCWHAVPGTPQHPWGLVRVCVCFCTCVCEILFPIPYSDHFLHVNKKASPLLNKTWDMTWQEKEQKKMKGGGVQWKRRRQKKEAELGYERG